MATRLYLQNAAAPYSPATFKGAWDDTASAVSKKIDTTKSGASTTVAVAEASATNNFDVAMLRVVSPALLSNKSISGTVSWIIGVLESAATANDFFHVHIYVTQGDSDSVRGTLLTDSIGVTEWPNTATGKGEGALTLSSVSALTGDRIVVEIGYQAQNTSTTSRTGTINYGGTGSDLTDGSTSVTTLVGWIEFSQDGLLALSGTDYTQTLSDTVTITDNLIRKAGKVRWSKEMGHECDL